MQLKTYGTTETGITIVAPSGWVILPEGTPVPSVHREYSENQWCAPRRCRSTMTPIQAQVWGHVLAFAIPEETV